MQWFFDWIAKRSGYTAKIDKALGQPRGEGSLLVNHLREIERLKSDIDKMMPLVEAVGSCECAEVPKHVYDAWRQPSRYKRREAFPKQPECVRQLVEAGWRFKWDAETSFVSAEHPLGGKQSVVEVLPVGRNGFDRNQIGQSIEELLNSSK